MLDAAETLLWNAYESKTLTYDDLKQIINTVERISEIGNEMGRSLIVTQQIQDLKKSLHNT